jgi:hypothetical protein
MDVVSAYELAAAYALTGEFHSRGFVVTPRRRRWWSRRRTLSARRLEAEFYSIVISNRGAGAAAPGGVEKDARLDAS